MFRSPKILWRKRVSVELDSSRVSRLQNLADSTHQLLTEIKNFKLTKHLSKKPSETFTLGPLHLVVVKLGFNLEFLKLSLTVLYSLVLETVGRNFFKHVRLF